MSPQAALDGVVVAEWTQLPSQGGVPSGRVNGMRKAFERPRDLGLAVADHTGAPPVASPTRLPDATPPLTRATPPAQDPDRDRVPAWLDA